MLYSSFLTLGDRVTRLKPGTMLCGNLEGSDRGNFRSGTLQLANLQFLFEQVLLALSRLDMQYYVSLAKKAVALHTVLFIISKKP